MTPEAYALVGLTAIVAGLVGVLVFAALRIAAAARDSRQHLRESGADTAVLAVAIQEAVGKLKAQERATAARAEASERLSGQIVASLTSGLLLVDLDGRVRILNPAGRQLLGGGDASAASYAELLGAETPLAQVIAEGLRTGQPILRREVPMPRGASGVTHVGVTVSPLLDEARALTGVICLFTDLSAVVDLEEQLRLKDALARVGELTAGLAHEFRNGLATIHGYARLMPTDQAPPDQRTCIEGIRQETDALGRIVTNFLSFARPDELHLAPVELEDLIAAVAADVRADAVRRGGSVDVGGEFAGVDGDEVLLRQAFGNLARNALEACGRAGIAPRIRFEGAVDRARRQVRVSVIDNGPGVDPALGERIFRPFFTTRPDGTGLGLAIVQKVIVTHNGRVQALAASGGGAHLLVTLPILARS